MKILLMGPQGSGKGTIGSMLSAELGFPLISIGDLLRAIPESHPRYKEVKDLMDAGELAPQDLIAELLANRISQTDCSKGYILDGWYRAMIDVEYLDLEPDIVIVINISRQESIRRITGRRICKVDGKTYNILTMPDKIPEKCKSDLYQRDDDTEEAVNERLDIYYSHTQEVIDFLKARGTSVVDLDGEKTPDQVLEDVMKVLQPII